MIFLCEPFASPFVSLNVSSFSKITL